MREVNLRLMETKVLTLFDDDDFLPQPPPSKKVKKALKSDNEKKNVEIAEQVETTPKADAIAISFELPKQTEISVKTHESIVAETPTTNTNQATTEPIADVLAVLPKNEPAAAQNEMGLTADSTVALPQIEAETEPTEAVIIDSNPIQPNNIEDTEVGLANNINTDSIEASVANNAAEQALSLPSSSLEQKPEIESKTTINIPKNEDDLVLSAHLQDAVTVTDDLDKQILTELILTDYTALLQAKPELPKTALVKAINNTVTEIETEKDTIAAKDNDPVLESENDETVERPSPALPDWQLDKKYYTIGEVAQLFGVNNSHIRFWTNEFKLKPRTTRKGDRLYQPELIAELRLIHDLVKVKKHTIKGAREKLKAEKEKVNQNIDLKDALHALKDMLVKIKEGL